MLNIPCTNALSLVHLWFESCWLHNTTWKRELLIQWRNPSKTDTIEDMTETQSVAIHPVGKLLKSGSAESSTNWNGTASVPSLNYPSWWYQLLYWPILACFLIKECYILIEKPLTAVQSTKLMLSEHSTIELFTIN